MMHEVLGVRIDDLPVEDIIVLWTEWLRGEKPHTIVTPNPEFVLLAKRSPSFHARLAASDLALPDGVGLRYAVAALGEGRLEHRLTGVDALEGLASLCVIHHKRLLLLGGAPQSGERAAVALRTRLGDDLDVQVANPGRVVFDGEQAFLEADFVHQIQALQPAVITVALGQGKQEAVMERLAQSVPSARILIGVGGALDSIGGSVRRAPQWMRARGLEWLWRLVRQPWRITRILNAVLVFPVAVIWATLRRRQFLKALSRVLSELFR